MGTQQFTATVTNANNTSVSWSVLEGPSGGSVSGGGLYTAPGNSGTFHIVAAALADLTRTASATMKVNAVVSISPNGATLFPAASQQFTASVAGLANQTVNWSVQEGPTGGSISSGGLYTAPNNSGTYHIVAAAQADPTRTATVTVRVNAVVTISPNGATLNTLGTQPFVATITGLSNQTVTWSVQEGPAGGSISASGLYTAPAVAGTYHVVATSQADPSSSASVVLTVEGLPDLSQFQVNRTSRFLVDVEFIDSGSPFKGLRANQPHAGGHVHWDNSTNAWPRGGTSPRDYPAIYAVADGYIHRIDYKLPVGAADRYGIDLAFAVNGSTIYSFTYSIEPMIPEPAPDFYRAFILVTPGQRVRKGDVIAYMYLPPGSNIGSHIHFHLWPVNASHFEAPAIFTAEVVDAFHARWGLFGQDGGMPMPSCMGYKLDASENPFGTGSIDVLK